jgi:hypothetical protein
MAAEARPAQPSEQVQTAQQEQDAEGYQDQPCERGRL